MKTARSLLSVQMLTATLLMAGCQQLRSEEITASNYFPHDPQATATYIESPGESTVTEKTRDKVSGESVLEHIESDAEWVQQVIGGELDQAKTYWSYESDGLYLHEMSYPGITSQSKGTVTLALLFDPPVKVMPLQTDEEKLTEAAVTGHIRYKITFDPVETDGFLGKTSQTNAGVADDYLKQSMTPEDARWIYRTSYSYQGREGRTIPLQQGDAELCTLEAIRSIAIEGVLNSKPIQVTLNTTNWLLDTIGTVESSEQIDLEYDGEVMGRTLQKKLTAHTQQQKLLPSLPLEDNHLRPGWNLIALPLVSGGYGDSDVEILTNTLKTIVTPKESAGNIVLYGQDAATDQYEWIQYAPCPDQMSGDAQGSVVIDQSNQRVKGGWIKVGVNDRIARQGLEDIDPLASVDRVQQGWNLLPLPAEGGVQEVENVIQQLGFEVVEYYWYSRESGWIGGRREVLPNLITDDVEGAIWLRLLRQ